MGSHPKSLNGHLFKGKRRFSQSGEGIKEEKKLGKGQTRPNSINTRRKRD